jgi:hypothetical protein
VFTLVRSGGANALRKQRVIVMEGLHELVQILQRPGVDDYIIRGIESLFAGYLCGKNLPRLFQARFVTGRQSFDLIFLAGIHDQHAIVLMPAPAFDQ